MYLTKAMFVFKQVVRIGVNNKMPLELYLACKDDAQESWVVCGIFEEDGIRYFDTIVANGLSWKLESTTTMFSDDTVESMLAELKLKAVVKSV